MSQLTVCLSFDFDAMSQPIATGSRNPAQLSRGEYAVHVLPRILDLLHRHQAPSTFFVPGHTALAFPTVVREIVAAGHELGHHGWVHENPADFDLDGERRIVERALTALDEVAGVRPKGYRSPACDLSENTIDVLLEYGFDYDSSCSATDFEPYFLRQGDRWTVDEPYVFGTPSKLLELPFSWSLDDFPHFEFDPGWSTEQSPPSTVREIWQAEFDWAYENAPGGVFTVCLHPEVIGRPARLMMFDAFVTEMRSRDGVAFSRMEDCAAAFRGAVEQRAEG